MPESYRAVKYFVLFKLHRTINFWRKIVGDMYEETSAFTHSGSVKRCIDGTDYTISWHDGEWNIFQ